MPTTEEIIKERARQIVQEIEAKAQAEAFRMLRNGSKPSDPDPKTPAKSVPSRRSYKRPPGPRWNGAEHAEALSLAIVDWLGQRENGSFVGSSQELLKSLRRSGKFGRTPPDWLPTVSRAFGQGWPAISKALQSLGVEASRRDIVSNHYEYTLRLPEDKKA